MQIYVGFFRNFYEFLLPLFIDFPFCYGAVVCPMAGWDVFCPQKNMSRKNNIIGYQNPRSAAPGIHH